MNSKSPKPLILLVLAVAVLFVVFERVVGWSLISNNPNTQAASPLAPDSSAGAERSKSHPSASTPKVVVNSVDGDQLTIPGSKQAKKIEALSTLNDVPILFFGKLLDQFENAVEGAEITGSVLYDNGKTTGTRKIYAVSDPQGLFRLEGGKGESLGIMPRKVGYALASTNSAFRYSHFYPKERHVPDELRPVVIRMWKRQGIEELVSIDKKFRVAFPEKPLRIDLVAGAIVDSGGDLMLDCFRSPGILSKRTPGDWRLAIEAVDGGVIEADISSYRVAFQAPADDYVDRFEIRMDAADKAWFDNVQKVFFVKSRRGQVFSKFSFSFHLNESPDGFVTIAFRGLANANGSRNWEEESK